MDGYVIYVENNIHSEQGVSYLKESIKHFAPWINLHKLKAITDKSEIDQFMKKENIHWNYPWSGSQQDFATGLKKSAYPTKNPYSRISCAIMHYSLWKKTAIENKPIFVFEHDAIFIKDIPENFTEGNKAPIIGLNSPFGATRIPTAYNNFVQTYNGDKEIIPAPRIDHSYIPQGLAGNSAYYITPNGGSIMLNLTKEHGLWPNDALMCRQLVPGLSVTKTYYTKVQGIQSTTSL